MLETDAAEKRKLAAAIAAYQTARGEVLALSDQGGQREAYALNKEKVLPRVSEAFEAIGQAVESMSARVTDRAQLEVTDVAAVAEESSASAEQVSASTQQTSASAQEIAASAQTLSGTAEQLNGLVRRFTLA